MLPLSVFTNRTFTAVNLVTFAVYAALGGVFFLVVLNLQVVTGFTPLGAGMAMLPITVLMLLLSARPDALAQHIGPRLPMTAGSMVCAAALVLLSRVDADSTYVTGVLPAVGLFGLGLSLTVAPLGRRERPHCLACRRPLTFLVRDGRDGLAVRRERRPGLSELISAEERGTLFAAMADYTPRSC